MASGANRHFLLNFAESTERLAEPFLPPRGLSPVTDFLEELRVLVGMVDSWQAMAVWSRSVLLVRYHPHTVVAMRATSPVEGGR